MGRLSHSSSPPAAPPPEAPASRLPHNPAVHKVDAAVGQGGEVVVVGDGDHCGAVVAGQAGEDVEHRLGVLRVQVAGRLVGQDHARAVGQGAGDGDALALAAGQLVGPLAGHAGQAQIGQQRRGTGAHRRLVQGAQPAHRDQHIAQRGELRQQEVELEHEAQPGQAQRRQRRAIQPRGVPPLQEHRAAGRPVEQAQQVQQRKQEDPHDDVWENISNQLDIDDTWNNISYRLDSMDRLARWERYSQLIAASILLLLLPYYFIQKYSYQKSGWNDQILIENNKITPEKNIKDQSKDIQKVTTISKKENKIKTFDDNIIRHNFIAAENQVNRGTKRRSDLKKTEKKNLKQKPMKYSNLTVVEPVNEIKAETKTVSHTPNKYYVGFSTSVKNNWLINNTTMNGLDKYELNATVPDFGKDIGLIAGLELSDHWTIQLESYIVSDMGQKYHEYINGHYLTREIDINYYKNTLLLKYKWNTISQSFSNVLFGVSGSFQENAVEKVGESQMQLDDISNFDLSGVIGYDHEFPVLNNIMFVSGIRLNYGFKNIYKGDNTIPASFRMTTTASIDFNMSVKYQFK